MLSRREVLCCTQVLSQGFKQHLGWCRGKRQEGQESNGAEGDKGAEDEADEEEEDGDPPELAAIEASKVGGSPLVMWIWIDADLRYSWQHHTCQRQEVHH